MKKQIPSAVALVVVVLALVVTSVVYWQGANQQVKLPDKPPSDPIELPPSQIGRPMPGGGTASAPLAPPK